MFSEREMKDQMMNEYHKINTVFKRDRATNRLVEGDYSCPEFEFLAGNVWTWSEKVDGTNIRVMLKNGAATIEAEDGGISAVRLNVLLGVGG